MNFNDIFKSGFLENVTSVSVLDMAVTLILGFAIGLFIIFALPFQTIWSYFAWTNQTLAAITLWCITCYLAKHQKPAAIALLPAVAMTYICSAYIFISPMMFGMENRTTAYILGGVLTAAILVAGIYKMITDRKSS